MGFRTIFPTFHDPWWPSLRLLHSLDDDLSLISSLFPYDPLPRGSRSSLPIRPFYTYRRAPDGAFLEIELPGVAKDDLRVTVQSKKLIIKAKRYRRQPGACSWKEVPRKECDKGHTERVVEAVYALSLRLGDSADLENVKANCCGDGLLLVHVPAKESSARDVPLGD